MKKSRLLKVIAAAFCVCVIATPCAVTPVFANSGPKAEHGVTSLGTVVRGESSALAVESEKLTFDLNKFPYLEETGTQSTVTAEYRFVNTSENTVFTTMAFPMVCERPYYSYHGYEQDAPEEEPKILVDGKEIEFETRYTLGSYSNFLDCVSLIEDDYIKDDFFSPDMQVTKLVVVVDLKDYDMVWCEGEISYLGENVRCAGTSGDNIFRFDFHKSKDGSEDENSECCGYIIGDASNVKINWRTYMYNDRLWTYDEVNVPISLEYSEITLKEMLAETKGKERPMSDIDWYNAVVRSMTRAGRTITRNTIEPYTSDFIEWYVYDVKVAPKGTITNVVTAPIYPTIYFYYEPPVYTYNYLLSPAAHWASFGKLTVKINTPYKLFETEGYQAVDGGYVREYETLPQGELEFQLCSVEDPKTTGNAIYIVLIVFLLLAVLFIVAPCIAGFIIAIVYLVKLSKKKKQQKS